MESVFDTHITVTLTMSENEAEWLRKAMQNPLSPPEDEESHTMRANFWATLTPPTTRSC